MGHCGSSRSEGVRWLTRSALSWPGVYFVERVTGGILVYILIRIWVLVCVLLVACFVGVQDMNGFAAIAGQYSSSRVVGSSHRYDDKSVCGGMSTTVRGLTFCFSRIDTKRCRSLVVLVEEHTVRKCTEQCNFVTNQLTTREYPENAARRGSMCSRMP